MIGFALPWALVGLLAAALPLLLHLAQRRDPPEVAFPAVRYLDDTTREHRRRLKLRHWLLLAVRTLLIVVIVLAAAGMTLRRARVGSHPASALALVIDNSASSGTMADGVAVLDRLVEAGQAVLARATTADRLWLITADGRARPGNAAQLRHELAALRATATRLDLGMAIQHGRDLVRGTGLPGEVVLVTDLQRSALSAAPGRGDILVLHPDHPAAANRGVLRLAPEAQPWGVAGGDVVVSLLSSDTAPVPVTLAFGGERATPRELLVTPGVPATLHLESRGAGWNILTASIPPDELRLDDVQQTAIQVAQPAVVRWDPTDRFLGAALDVLVADHRVVPGDVIRVGSLGPGPSLLFPPEDPAQLGGLNRALAARGIPWQFGTVMTAPASVDSSVWIGAPIAIAKRVALRPTSASADVLASVGGDPWLVRGGDVLILGSRPDPAWTDLPLSAAFVPLIDALLTRAIRGATAAPAVSAGAVFTLPTLVTQVVHDGIATPVEGGAPWRAQAPGIYYLLAASDTIGSVSVQVDPRESSAERASEREARSLWPDAIVTALDEGPAYAFGATRGDLRRSLLVIGLVCVLAETMLARRRPRVSA